MSIYTNEVKTESTTFELSQNEFNVLCFVNRSVGDLQHQTHMGDTEIQDAMSSLRSKGLSPFLTNSDRTGQIRVGPNDKDIYRDALVKFYRNKTAS